MWVRLSYMWLKIPLPQKFKCIGRPSISRNLKLSEAKVWLGCQVQGSLWLCFYLHRWPGSDGLAENEQQLQLKSCIAIAFVELFRNSQSVAVATCPFHSYSLSVKKKKIVTIYNFQCAGLRAIDILNGAFPYQAYASPCTKWGMALCKCPYLQEVHFKNFT